MLLLTAKFACRLRRNVRLPMLLMLATIFARRDPVLLWSLRAMLRRHLTRRRTSLLPTNQSQSILRLLRRFGDLNSPIVRFVRQLLPAPRAVVVDVLAPAEHAGQTGEADADETEQASCDHCHAAVLFRDTRHGLAIAEGAVDELGLVVEAAEGRNVGWLLGVAGLWVGLICAAALLGNGRRKCSSNQDIRFGLHVVIGVTAGVIRWWCCGRAVCWRRRCWVVWSILRCHRRTFCRAGKSIVAGERMD